MLTSRQMLEAAAALDELEPEQRRAYAAALLNDTVFLGVIAELYLSAIERMRYNYGDAKGESAAMQANAIEAIYQWIEHMAKEREAEEEIV